MNQIEERIIQDDLKVFSFNNKVGNKGIEAVVGRRRMSLAGAC